MRISDWSSDVCSFDLAGDALSRGPQQDCRNRTDRMRFRFLPLFIAVAVLGTGVKLSDLWQGLGAPTPAFAAGAAAPEMAAPETAVPEPARETPALPTAAGRAPARTRGVEGKGVSVRVDSGGRRISQQKKPT